MIFIISQVLTNDELGTIRSNLRPDQFVDGRTTAGWHAKLVKQNTQLRHDAPGLSVIRQIVQAALKRNELFQMAVLPKFISPVLISRYECGMQYGSHVDNAFMGEGSDRLRSDNSFTLFLSDPATYTGGELVIENTQGEQAFKLEAGAMIVYPSSTIHRVELVTAGVRMAAIAWVQSMVRDVGDREILFDLDTARQIIFKQYGKTPEFDLLSKSYANLLRKWGEV